MKIVNSKWLIAVVSILTSGIFVISPPNVSAASDIRVTINESDINFPDQKPIMDQNRVLIPTRFVAQSLGCEVNYAISTKTVTIKKETKEKSVIITLQANSTDAKVSEKWDTGGLDRKITLDVPAKIVKGRILVPLRFVSETLRGTSVDWQQANRLVTIQSGIIPDKSPTTMIKATDSDLDTELLNKLSSPDIEGIIKYSEMDLKKFHFDSKFNTLAPKLFLKNMYIANGKLTLTIPKLPNFPNGVSSISTSESLMVYNDNGELDHTKSKYIGTNNPNRMMPGKTYTFALGKTNANTLHDISITYANPDIPTKETDALIAENYSIDLENGVILSTVSENNKLINVLGTIPEVIELAQKQFK